MALVHALLGLVLWKPNIIKEVGYKIGMRPPELTPFYNTMLTFQLRMDACNHDESTIFIGDSIIQGLCVSCITNKAINFGIASDTTFGVLERLKRYDSIKHAKAVVIEVGLNDLSRRKDEDILENYIRMIRLIPDKTKIIFSSILPIDSKLERNKFLSKSRIENINKHLRDICSSESNCTLMDSTNKLVDDNGDLLPEYHIGDGVHLNSDGYDIWINDLKNALGN